MYFILLTIENKESIEIIKSIDHIECILKYQKVWIRKRLWNLRVPKFDMTVFWIDNSQWNQMCLLISMLYVEIRKKLTKLWDLQAFHILQKTRFVLWLQTSIILYLCHPKSEKHWQNCDKDKKYISFICSKTNFKKNLFCQISNFRKHLTFIYF